MKTLFKYLQVLIAVALAGLVPACSSDDDEGLDIDFSIRQTEVSFKADGGTLSVTATTPAALTVASSEPWLSATATAPSPTTGASVITLTAIPNTAIEARTAFVTVSAAGHTADIQVTQEAFTVRLATPVTSFSFSIEGGYEGINVTAPAALTVESSAEWLTVDVEGPDSQGNAFLVLAVEPNPTYKPRTATITLASAGETLVLSIRQEAATDPEAEKHFRAMTLAPLMYPGWNLGNTLEAPASGLNAETSWQSTRTTQEILDYVASLGFRSVRIPCSWNCHADAAGRIDPEWTARVKEVVDYALQAGLYVLLNDHWDSGWVENNGFTDLSESNQAAKAERMGILWTQIAEAFQDYDEHLLFAGLNEPNANDDDAEKARNKVAALVRYEQAFIDAVRNTGGNNSLRTLVVQGPATDIDQTNTHYTTLPTDPAVDGHLMVEVHYYSPWNFCGLEKDESWGNMFWFWGAGNHVSGSSRNATWGEESYMLEQFQKMKRQFADRGIPVILGEYGCQWRSLSANQDEHDASVKLFHKLVNQYGPQNGCIPMVWDINYLNQGGTTGVMTIIDRAKRTIYCPFAMDGIREGVAATSWPY